MSPYPMCLTSAQKKNLQCIKVPSEYVWQGSQSFGVAFRQVCNFEILSV